MAFSVLRVLPFLLSLLSIAILIRLKHAKQPIGTKGVFEDFVESTICYIALSLYERIMPIEVTRNASPQRCTACL